MLATRKRSFKRTEMDILKRIRSDLHHVDKLCAGLKLGRIISTKRKRANKAEAGAPRPSNSRPDPIAKSNILQIENEGFSSEGQPEQDVFQLLPDEIIVEILSYLSASDLAHRVSMVSRRLREVSLNARLWTEVEIRTKWAVDETTARRLLQRCTCLKKLVIRLKKDDDDAFGTKTDFLSCYALMHCPALEALNLHRYSPNVANLLKTVATYGGSLRRLVIRGGRLWTGSALRANTIGLANLTHVELHDLDAEGLKAMADCCKSVEHFEHEGEGEDWCDDVMNFFLEGVKASLRCLVIGGRTLTDASFKSILKCKLLKRLDVRRAQNLNWRGLEAISNLPDLSRLSIRQGFKLKDLDFVQAFGGRCLESLTTLSTTGCDFGDRGLEAIVKACHNLVHLDVGSTYSVHVLKDKSLRAIADSCRRLEHLSVDRSFPNFSEEAVDYFLGKVKHTIRRLSMSHLTGIGSLTNLGKCERLESLTLLYPLRFKRYDLQYVLKLPALISLSIVYLNEFSGRDFVHAFRRNSRPLNLTSLDLTSCCRLNDRALKHVANSCPELRHLGLSGCNKITAVGVRHILLRCPKLNSLDVGGSTFPAETFRNSSLTVLTMSSTGDDSRHIAEHAKISPRLDVQFRTEYSSWC